MVIGLALENFGWFLLLEGLQVRAFFRFGTAAARWGGQGATRKLLIDFLEDWHEQQRWQG